MIRWKNVCENYIQVTPAFFYITVPKSLQRWRKNPRSYAVQQVRTPQVVKIYLQNFTTETSYKRDRQKLLIYYYIQQ